MPAITADTLALPRVSAAGPIDTERPVRSITTGPRGHEGEGFPVVRAFAGVSSAALDPFVHMDQMGEVEYQPGEPSGTDWHPHRGFETVTYMIDGRFAHQDSHGGGGLIADGATQWMTAGAGILHIETPPAELVESGGMFHGIQLWVNLPKKDKFATPRYQAIEGADVALLSSDDGGALIRVIAGRDRRSQRARCHAHADHYGARHNSTGGAAEHPVEPGLQRAGLRPRRAWLGRRRSRIRSSKVSWRSWVPATGSRSTPPPSQESRVPALEVLILGGRPIREPVFHYGPFVMNTKAEVVQAVEDFQAGKFGSVPPNGLMPHRAT